LHFLEGGDKDKALDYFLKAGDRAAKIYANAEAASYLQHALSLLEEKEGELQEKASILERLGDVEKLVGKYDDCVKHWNEALPLWTKLQKKDKTATLHRKMANVFWDTIGDTEKAKEHHEAALRILEAESESVELARLYEDVAHMLRRKGKWPEALIWAEKSLVLAEKLNALEAEAIACCELSVLSNIAANYKKAREYVERALKTALDNSYLETALWAYMRAADATHPEEYEKRSEYIEKGLALAKKVGNITFQAGNLLYLAGEYSNRGELAKAITLGEEALALDKKAGNKTSIPWDLCALGGTYLRLGEWEESEQFLTEAMDKARGTDELASAFWGHQGFGELHFDKEEYAKAKKWFEEGVDIWSKAGGRPEDTPLYFSLVSTCIELGEIEIAQNLLDGLRKLALETEEKWSINVEMVLRAMLFRAQKKWDESIELFEKALREWESIKADIWNAYCFARRVLCEYARACLERNGEGEKEKAGSLLNQALEMFQKMGAKKDVEKVEARLLYIETGKAASVPKPTELVATGYADLDKLLCGGVPSSSAVVLTSPSCNERDLLVKSFLETGAKKDEVTFYATTNPGSAKPLAEDFQSNFYLFICNPQADTIIKSAPNVTKLKGVENLTEISIALTSAIRKLDPVLKGPRRICMGLVSDVLLQHHAVQTRRWLTGLIPELQSEGFTTLAVMDPEIHPPEEVRAISGLFEGEIDICEKETEKGLQKFLKIKKMSNQEYLENELLLKKEDLQKRK
jgi:tetratricopeptide (TPR) repeat protein/KaiC/GvpD/RAD55 family RecA-like ATPase